MTALRPTCKRCGGLGVIWPAADTCPRCNESGAEPEPCPRIAMRYLAHCGRTDEHYRRICGGCLGDGTIRSLRSKRLRCEACEGGGVLCDRFGSAKHCTYDPEKHGTGDMPDHNHRACGCTENGETDNG